MMKRVLFIIACLIIFMVPGIVCTAQINYQIKDLVMPYGQFNEISTSKINDISQVIGRMWASNGESEHLEHLEFLWTAKTGMLDLGMLLDRDVSVNSINNTGQVTGAMTVGQVAHGFTWIAGKKVVDVNTLLKFTKPCIVYDINDNGRLCGSLLIDAISNLEHPFVQDINNKTIILDNVNGKACYINNFCQVCGVANDNSCWVWDLKTGVTYLSLPSSLSEETVNRFELRGMNNLGQIIGYVSVSDGDHILFWDTNRSVTDLNVKLGLDPDSCEVNGINDLGQIVGGFLSATNSEYHAFVWSEESGLIDLGTLLDGNNSCASSINIKGEIAGRAEDSIDRSHVVMWKIASLDITVPRISISKPTTSVTYTATSPLVTISGTASDNVGLTDIKWYSDRGVYGTCTGTTAWSINGFTPAIGQNVITVIARDAAGNVALDKITINYKPTLKVVLTADATSIYEGGQTTLRWISTFASKIVSSNFDANILSGSKVISPAKTTAYTIKVASEDGRTATAAVTVKVLPIIPVVTLTADSTSLIPGQSTTLRWTSQNANQVISSSFGAQSVNGSLVITPAQGTTSYTIKVGSSTTGRVANAIVVVKSMIPKPTVTLTADSTTLIKGQTTTLYWNSSAVAFIAASNFGATSLNGSMVIAPTKTTIYTIAAVNSSGQRVSAAITIKVIPKDGWGWIF